MTVETRYFRDASALLTTQGSNLLSTLVGSSNSYVTMGIRVYVLHADTSTTEITSGTPVAQGRRGSTGYVSGTWACPETSILATDAIRVEVWGKLDTTSFTLETTHDTEVLGVTQLDGVTWTVTYHVTVRYLFYTYYGYWDYNIAAANSRIDNFSYSTPAPPSAVLRRLKRGVGL